MLRYFIIATILVVGTLIAITAVHSFSGVHIRVGKGKGHVVPLPARPPTMHPRGKGGLRGDAPWALSALPECLIQIREWSGSLEFVSTRLPRGATRIVPPATLYYADCTVSISDDEALVVRGEDRLRIPPFSRFYRLPNQGLALVRSTHCPGLNCASVLRIYERPHG
jgi:hypothetical protein